MKKIIYIITILIFSLSIDVFASSNYQVRTEDNYGVPSYIEVTDENREAVLSTPLVNSDEKIYDFADKFTDEEEAKLYGEVKKYIDGYNMDMAIVTISENNKQSAKEYAMDFYDYNTFGISDSHDGLLLVMDFDTREMYIVTTCKAINMYTDRRIDSMLDDIEVHMTGDYYKAALTFIDSASDFASLGYPNPDGSEPKAKGINRLKQLPWSGILIFSIVSTVIIMIILICNNKLVRKATSSRQYLLKDSVKINLVKETYLGKSIHKSARVQSSSSSSSSFGGSHTSSGSSGTSHGGGGRSF